VAEFLTPKDYMSTVTEDRLAETIIYAREVAQQLRETDIETQTWKLEKWSPEAMSNAVSGWILAIYHENNVEDQFSLVLCESLICFLGATGELGHGLLKRHRHASSAKRLELPRWIGGAVLSLAQVETIEDIVQLERSRPIARGGFCDSVLANLEELQVRAGVQPVPAPLPQPKRKSWWWQRR